VATASTPAIRTENITWILLAQAFTLIPLLWHLPPWLWGLWGLAVAWRWLIQAGRSAFPNTWVKILLALTVVAGLYVSLPQQTGTEAMVGLLVCSFVLKLVELKTRKDGLLLIYIGFIAVAAQFLFDQQLLNGLYGLFCIACLLTAWQTIYQGQAHSLRFKVARGAVLLAHSLPLLLVLFVVMPRLGPLWTVPVPEGRGKTGFTDSLTLGDIGQLVKNGDPAFRVTFAGPAPSARQLYWRGLVLDDFDGRSWHAHQDLLHALVTPVAPEQVAGLVDYTVILEPHEQHWLFTLPMAVKADAGHQRLLLHPEGLLRSQEPVSSRLQYSVTSATDVTYSAGQSLSPQAQRLNTALPPSGNRQARALATSWSKAGLSSEEKMAAALALFNATFTYSLQPPTLGTQAIDEFLFTTKKGFCEHFASSFTFLMRAAGVPARVVVGYQGGRFNEVENYLLVSQSDAHAWVEVWQDGRGWISVDPTAAVAPSRIEEGLDGALSADDRALVGAAAWSQGNSAWPIWQKRWDAAGFAWQRWVLNYDKDKQQRLFSEWLGGEDPWRLLAALLALCAVFAACFVYWLLRGRHPEPPSALAQLLKPLYRKLLRWGISPEPGETPQQLLTRFGQLQPQYRIPARVLAQLIETLAYAEDPSVLPQLRRHLAVFPQLPSPRTTNKPSRSGNSA
jgi:protein-glutamine gamma-glutamyltransferase